MTEANTKRATLAGGGLLPTLAGGGLLLLTLARRGFRTMTGTREGPATRMRGIRSTRGRPPWGKAARRMVTCGSLMLVAITAPTSGGSYAAARQPAPAAPQPASSLPASLPGSPDIPALVARVNPAVVNITATQEVRRRRPDWPFDFFFGVPPGTQRQPRDQFLQQRALGTGFVVDAEGHVLTNAHVVEDANDVRVKLADGREFAAKIVGRDSSVDIAVLRLQGAKDLPLATLGSSGSLQVGQYVVAIGNPFGLGNTVTLGIVSAKGRAIGAGPYDDFIQTDASINPGNSGGPLFNLKGEVVGINTAINASGQGIGFAIPIDIAKEELPEIIATGHARHGMLGVTVQPLDETMAKALGLDRPRGALVAAVTPGSPAAESGIKAGDVILSVDGSEVPSSADLPRMIAFRDPGEQVTMNVWRNGTEQTIGAVLGEAREPSEPGESDQGGPNRGGGPPAARPSGMPGIAVSDSPQGVVVTQVAPGGSASGRLRPGDRILEVNHVATSRAADVERSIREAPKGKPILLKIERDGMTLFVAVPRS